eukprot:bmy_17965T0
MSHRKIHLALSLVLILCGLFNSIFCEKQQDSQQNINLVLLKKIPSLSQKTEAGYKAFAQELFRSLIIEDPRKNIIFSPVAISIALATLSLGIKSTMRTNLIEDLGLDLRKIQVLDKDQHLVQTWHELVKQEQLKHKDILFIDNNRKINQMFLQEIDRVHEVDIQTIDFKDTEKTKKAINQYVAEKVHKKIKDLITRLDPQTVLCLVNYVFFKGIWERAFQTNLTQKEDFLVNENTKVQVDMMRKTERMIYSHSEELLATMVKMPYKGNVSIILVLPDVGQFHFALREITAKRARLQKASDFRLVHLVLPKFKISSKINLKHLLPKIDIKDMPTTTAATQSITKKASLSILEAVHQAEIEVSEHGLITDAAKDTDVWKVPVDTKEVPVVVKFNRPFLLFVEDQMTQRDLFRMGPAWQWLLGAGILASVYCQPFPARGDKSLGVPEAPRGQLSEALPAYRKITPTITNFALRLYKQLAAETPGNIFFSPVSISSTLALLSLGAQADTPAQILEGLGFNLTETPEADIHRGFQSLIHTLDLPSPKLELKVGNSLFLDKQLKPQQHFLDNIRELYRAFAFSVNFTDSNTTRRQINDYVRKQTYGQWKHPFNCYQTQKQESFFVDERTSLRIPMMHQKEMHRFLYDQEVACTVLQMEYSGNALALLILPDPGKMAQVEDALQPETLRKWDQLLLPSLLDLHLPRFSISGTYNLEEILPHIGLTGLFNLEADFSGITGQLNRTISRVSHKAAVDVSERGTEAGVASGLLSQPQSLNATSAPHAHFNRPFLVLLWEVTTQSLLFLGKVVNPAVG